MGTPRSFVSYGPQWAEAGSAPFRYFKSMATEGAVIAPMIISGHGVNSQNKIYNNFISLMDLAPTFYELAEATYPQRLGDREFFPMKGKSITPIFNDMNRIIHDSTSVFTVEHGERVILIKDNWKLVNEEPPFEKENFKLFNLSNDLAELRNLREREKEKFDELIKEWNKYSSEIGVQFPTPE
jgi:arylsulfatase